LVAEFVQLIIRANILVDKASSAAKRLNIKAMVIRLTVLVFGTSAPE
jgi:Ca2+/Na+ antiporter